MPRALKQIHQTKPCGLRKCVEKANAARTAIVEDSPEVDLRTCIEASEAISEFVDGKGMLKDEVLKILLAALDEVSNISPEIQEDFEMEIEDLPMRSRGRKNSFRKWMKLTRHPTICNWQEKSSNSGNVCKLRIYRIC